MPQVTGAVSGCRVGTAYHRGVLFLSITDECGQQDNELVYFLFLYFTTNNTQNIN